MAGRAYAFDLTASRILHQALVAAGACVVLLVPVVLSVYKPLGMTRYEARTQHKQHVRSRP